ncbi:MAG: antibiotic biosynthesis monooxygenase [Candidatus Omnitrophica bacterium]|nr:antibiotic biosynthesis monooxygenase [Candidatus Omnitrophota bacterium]
MIVATVEIHVREDKIDEFIKIIVDNHRESVKEPGNLRFDVLQSIEDPSRFTLYEAYETEEASAAHKKTPHYLKWRELAENMMAKPRKGTAHRVIAPQEKSMWR